MNLELLKMLGQIAGIGGIALGVFLLLFRDVIRKKIFPKLSQKQGYHVILIFMILSWSVAIAGVAAWVIIKTKSESASNIATRPVLTASLWKVNLDTKGSLITSKEFTGQPGGSINQLLLDDIVDWISRKLEIPADYKPQHIKVSVYIPADLSTEKPVISRKPEGPIEVLMWDTRGGGKIRIPLSVEMLRTIDGEFHLEIRVPGFGQKVVTVTRGRLFDETFDLVSTSVSVGIEQFEGEGAGISDRLAQQLSLRQGIKVTSPDILKSIREEIKMHNERIARNPQIQMPLRKLGIDYIISGSIQYRD
jgi:hypothetical protein